jgi:hypothetical protein
MALTSIDWSSANTKPMPSAKYPAEFVDFEVVEPITDVDAEGNKKYPYIKLVFEVAYEDPEADPDDDEGVRKLFRNASLSPKSLKYTKRALINLGVDPDAFNVVKGESVAIEPLLEPLKGDLCVLDVGASEYLGELRNEIKAILPAGSELLTSGGTWK